MRFLMRSFVTSWTTSRFGPLDDLRLLMRASACLSMVSGSPPGACFFAEFPKRDSSTCEVVATVWYCRVRARRDPLEV